MITLLCWLLFGAWPHEVMPMWVFLVLFIAEVLWAWWPRQDKAA